MLYFRLYFVNMTNVTHLLFLLHDNTERIMIQTYSNQSHKKNLLQCALNITNARWVKTVAG